MTSQDADKEYGQGEGCHLNRAMREGLTQHVTCEHSLPRYGMFRQTLLFWTLRTTVVIIVVNNNNNNNNKISAFRMLTLHPSKFSMCMKLILISIIP